MILFTGGVWSWGECGFQFFRGGGGLQFFFAGGGYVVSNFSGGVWSLNFFFNFFFLFFFPISFSPKFLLGCTNPPPRDGQCAGGTHPTGMHSCFKIFRFRERQSASLTEFSLWSEKIILSTNASCEFLSSLKSLSYFVFSLWIHTSYCF